MARYNPQDDWFGFYYKRWKTSPNVQKMNLNERGLYLEIIVGIAEYGELPVDPWKLKTLLGIAGDYRTIIRWFKSFGHLCSCSICGSSPVTVSQQSADSQPAVSLQCGHSNFTVPKFSIFKEKMGKSRGSDVPKQTKAKQSIHARHEEQAEQAPAELNATPSLSPEEPHTECPKCGFYPCQQKLFCPKPDSPVLVKKAAKPAVAKRPAADPLRNWDEEVDGVPGERIRLCVRFMLDIKKEPWFISNISVAALRRPGFLHKLVDECPSDAEIQKQLKATIKTKWDFDAACPHKCDRGKISVNRPGSLFPIVEHCECLHEVELA